MTTNTQIAPVQPLQVVNYEQQSPSSLMSYRLPSGDDLKTIMDLAKAFSESGMYRPEGGAPFSPAACLAILMTGLDLGLSPTQSMMSIYSVMGKPSISSQLMGALCLQHPDVCLYLTLVETTREVATYETLRAGAPAPVVISYTIEDARAAGLLGKSNWKMDTPGMLVNRCLTRITRAVYPDLTRGMYSREELEDRAYAENEISRTEGKVSSVQNVQARLAAKRNKIESTTINEPSDAELSNIVKALRGACGLSGKAAYADYLRDNYGNNTGTLAGMPREDILLVIEGLKEKAESIAQANRQAPEELPVVEVENSGEDVQDGQKPNAQVCEHPGCGEVLSAFQAERSITKFGTFLCKAHEGQS